MSQRALMGVLAGNMLLDALEVSVLLPALPPAATDLGLGISGAQWLMGGFAAGFAVFLLAGPVLARRWGRRRLYLVALVVFAAASVVGGLIDVPAAIVATRVVKGSCAAFTAPAGLAIIGDVFPGQYDRARAVGVYSLFGASGFTAGLVFSGFVTLASWRWVLVFTAPVALALAVVAARVVPRDRAVADPRWFPQRVSPRLVRAAVGAALLNGAYLGYLLLTTFTLQQGLGWRPWQVAAGLLPVCAPLVAATRGSRRLIARCGTGPLVAAGAFAAAAACGVSCIKPERTSYVTDVLPALILFAVAFVLSFAALNARALEGIPPEERAASVALYQCVVQCGAVVALFASAMIRQQAWSDRPALLILTSLGVFAFAIAIVGRLPVRSEGVRS
ncbi:MFS transporter [Amycolatopsis carbonis]|uniref:MFS transporter n=1 Tax=Amycolatopsis carbonis TaxID=715471 RepID=A0A9Y2IBB4_9PSEU|nr:MFS transporter [Amycolatopsis sp. 2-15]WIX76942.1 MFS transporter [Amycolatopsis sp. 2-15]